MTRPLRHAVWTAILFMAAFALSLTAHGQGLGRISGTVTDSSGAAVPDAKVTLTRTATGEVTATTTDSAGGYVFPSVPPAQYSLTATASGFSTYTEANATLEADQALTVNATLKVGATSETVTVTDQPPQVDTTTGTLAQVIGRQQVNEMPLNGRNAATLTTLVAGVVIAPNAQADQGATKTFPVAVTVTANGTHVGQTNYLLDGGNNVDEYTNVNAPFPMPDAVQEFSVQTSNYSAQYGQNAGGVVNIITRGGSNQYHGDLFEYVRNRVFNAANYFSYVNGVKTVDPLKRNQFGGTIGGPLSIPHLYNAKDKTFFFVGYQKTISHTSSTSATAAVLPTTAQLAGQFNFTTTATPGTPAFYAACIANPKLATATPNASQCYPYVSNGGTAYTATIPTASFNAASLALLKYLPSGGSAGTFNFIKPSFTNYGELTARVDQVIGKNDKATARYFSDGYHLNGVLNLQDLLTYSDQADIHYYNALVSETHTFSEHLLNNFILSYQVENASRGPLPGSISVNDLGVNIWQPAFKQINQIAVTNFFTVGDNPQGFFRRANYTLNDDVHWQLGGHDIAFGFHGELSKVDVNNLFQQPGLFTFNGNVTNNAIASYLLGYTSNFAQASGQFLNLRGKFFGMYAEDSWKASRRLTLNYGLRYEPFLPWHEKEGRMGSFFPGAYAANTHSTLYPLAPAGLLFAGDPGFNPKNGVPEIYNHVMPRFGFAWDVFGNGRTAVRGGSGMFFDSRMSSVFYNIYSNTSPFITNVNISSLVGGPSIYFTDPYGTYGTTNPFPAPQPPPSTAAIPPQAFLTYDPFHSFHTPLVYAWNLAVEQQLSTGLLARIAYVGTHISHQWTPVEINPVLNADAVPTTNTNQYNRRRYNPASLYTGSNCTANNCYSQPITEANMGMNGIYHSLQMSLEQRMHNGLTLLANYTWSKSLDNAPYNLGATAIASGNSYVLPIYEPNFKRLDYGPSDFDHRHVVSISAVYTEPKVMKDAPSGLRYLVNGWQLSGLFQSRSGDPLTVMASNSNLDGSAQNRDRAVVTSAAYGGSACPATAHCKNWLNPASFANPAAGAYGSVVKGSFLGPRYTDMDAALLRSFPVTETSALQLRAEYFNIFNHTNFGDPNTTLGGTFGEITGTAPQLGGASNDPRIAQFSARFVF
jgi:hypothetical protein